MRRVGSSSPRALLVGRVLYARQAGSVIQPAEVLVPDSPESVLVIGGAGRTGRLVVDQALHDGMDVRVLTRRSASSDRVHVVTGSITSPARVRTAVDGVAAVVIVVESDAGSGGSNPPEEVHHRGVRHVLDAVDAGTRLVLISQIYITRPQAYPEVADTIAARARGEQALRDSGLAYTIVRPAWLTDEPAGRSGLRFEQGDTGDGQVARADVAAVAVQALRTPQAVGRTFELYNQPGTPDIDWAAAFGQLEPDNRR